jgi:uncharacterized membrane protein (DUF2068 family)
MKTKSPFGLRIIAILKIISSTLLLCAAFGLFHLLRSDIALNVEHFVHRLHLDPDNHYVTAAMASISGMSPKRLKEIDAGTFFYALLYLTEGLGLLFAKHWAEYLTVIATGMFIPLELYEVIRKVNLLRTGVLLINIVIVFYLLFQVQRNIRAAHHR